MEISIKLQKNYSKSSKSNSTFHHQMSMCFTWKFSSCSCRLTHQLLSFPDHLQFLGRPDPRLLLRLPPFLSPALLLVSDSCVCVCAGRGASWRSPQKALPQSSPRKPPTVTASPTYTPLSLTTNAGDNVQHQCRIKGLHLDEMNLLTHVSVILFNAAPSVLLYQSFHKTPRLLPVADIRRDPADTHTMGPSAVFAFEA